MRADEEDVFQAKRDPTAGLDLWTPRPTLAMPGASDTARALVAPHLNTLQAKVLQGVTAYQPITREDLALALGMKDSTLRPRVCELIELKRIHVSGYTDSPRRGLLAVTPPTPTEETDR